MIAQNLTSLFLTPPLLLVLIHSAFAQDPSKEPEVAIKAAQKELAIKKTRVRILVSPNTATITQNKKVVAQGTLEVELAPGSHEFTLAHPGYKTHIETLLITPSAPEILLRVHLKEEQKPTIETWEPGLVSTLESARNPVGWASLGVGVGLIIVSTILTHEDPIDDRCSATTPEFCVPRRTNTSWGTLTGVMGGLFTASGMTLLAWDTLSGTPKKSPQERTKNEQQALTLSLSRAQKNAYLLRLHLAF